MASVESTMMGIFETALISISLVLIFICMMFCFFGANKPTKITGAILTVYPTIVVIYCITKWMVKNDFNI